MKGMQTMIRGTPTSRVERYVVLTATEHAFTRPAWSSSLSVNTKHHTLSDVAYRVFNSASLSTIATRHMLYIKSISFILISFVVFNVLCTLYRHCKCTILQFFIVDRLMYKEFFSVEKRGDMLYRLQSSTDLYQAGKRSEGVITCYFGKHPK